MGVDKIDYAHERTSVVARMHTTNTTLVKVVQSSSESCLSKVEKQETFCRRILYTDPYKVLL